MVDQEATFGTDYSHLYFHMKENVYKYRILKNSYNIFVFQLLLKMEDTT